MFSSENLLGIMENATPHSTGNHSNTTREELIDILSTFQKVSLAVPYFIIEPVALILNFLILFIIWNREKHAREASQNVPQNMLRSQLRTYYFLRHLIFSDLLTCFVAIPMDAFEIYRLEFRRSHQYCAASKYVRLVAISTSFYILVVTNFERFWSLTFPFRKLSERAVVFMIRGAWLVVPVINIPFLFLFYSQIENIPDNRHYVRVCVAEPGIKEKIALAYTGITLFIPAIVIAAFSGIIIYRVLQIGKAHAHNTNSPKDEHSHADSPKVGIRSIALFSTYVTAGFWLCISPAGFYYIIIVANGRPEFPSSYLITLSLVVIINASAAVNPVVTLLCFQPIRDRAKRYLGLGVRKSYSTRKGINRATAEENNNVQLFSMKVRSSFRKMRYILKGTPAENGNGDLDGAAKTDKSAQVSSGGQTVMEETVISTIERNSNDCRPDTIQRTEI